MHEDINLDTNEITYLNNYRLTIVAKNDKSNLTSIFLPGGPGLGSEYLVAFAKSLDLPGRTILADYPNDGSNRIANYQISWPSWRDGLLAIVEKFQPCILVTHSFGGMLALSLPELEHKLIGLVLINTTPTKRYSGTSG